MIPRVDERPNTIALQVAGKYEEGRAVTAIYPGMALEVTTDNQNPTQLPPTVKANPSTTISVLRIAMECLLGNPDETKREGMKVSDAYAAGTALENYADGDLVPFFSPLAGDIFQVRVASIANFAIGDILQQHTDGTFVAVASGTAKVQVMEDYDFTADGASTIPLLRVQAV